MGYGDFSHLQHQQQQYGMPISGQNQIQGQGYGTAVSLSAYEQTAQKVNDVFAEAHNTSATSATGALTVVSIHDEHAIAALHNTDTDQVFGIEQQTIDTIVDAVMNQLHGPEKNETSRSSPYLSSLTDAKANVQEKHKALEALPKGTVEWNVARESLKEAKSQYNQLVNSELKSAKEELATKKSEYNEVKFSNKVSKEEKNELKEMLGAAESRYLQASRLAIENVVRFGMENKNKASEGDLYLRSDITQLAVPVTITEKGDVIVALKNKLGDKLGQGGFKAVKLAFVLSFEIRDSLQVSVRKAVSATMSPKTELDKRAVAIENSMLERLQELSKEDPAEGVVESMTVTTYKNKDSSKPEEKIAVVMHHCNGGDLEGKKLSAEEKKQVGADILTGLNWLHRNNIFHSDMKPGNVLLNEENGVLRAKIGDFGCSRDIANSEQRTYSAGDRTYISPEIYSMHMNFIQNMSTDPHYPELQDKREAFLNAEKKVAACSEKVTERTIALEKAEQNPVGGEVDRAKQELANAKTEFKENKKIYDDARKSHDTLEDSMSSRHRPEAYAIDETILKADVFAAGIIFEGLFMGVGPDKLALLAKSDDLLTSKEIEKKQKVKEKIADAESHLAPELKELIAEMKEPDVSKRISASEALERFQAIKDIYIEDEAKESGSDFTGQDVDSVPQSMTSVYGVSDQEVLAMIRAGGAGY